MVAMGNSMGGAGSLRARCYCSLLAEAASVTGVRRMRPGPSLAFGRSDSSRRDAGSKQAGRSRRTSRGITYPPRFCGRLLTKKHACYRVVQVTKAGSAGWEPRPNTILPGGQTMIRRTASDSRTAMDRTFTSSCPLKGFQMVKMSDRTFKVIEVGAP